MSWKSYNRKCVLRLFSPQTVLKYIITFIQPYLSIYLDGVLWTTHYFKCFGEYIRCSLLPVELPQVV